MTRVSRRVAKQVPHGGRRGAVPAKIHHVVGPSTGDVGDLAGRGVQGFVDAHPAEATSSHPARRGKAGRLDDVAPPPGKRPVRPARQGAMTPTAAAAETFHVNGVDLAWSERGGSPDGTPTLVLCHGFTGSSLRLRARRWTHWRPTGGS